MFVAMTYIFCLLPYSLNEENDVLKINVEYMIKCTIKDLLCFSNMFVTTCFIRSINLNVEYLFEMYDE
jgi:hypothetical protein